MRKKRGSILGNLGWGLAGEVLFFAAVLAIASVFSISSIPNAYFIAVMLLIVALVSFFFYKKWKKSSS